MKVALMWTINDFSVNEMVSGWNMHEQLIFPYYMENNKAFALTNSGKMSLFFFIATNDSCQDHKYRKNIKAFFVGRVERDVAACT
jgi:hypothetical protein